MMLAKVGKNQPVYLLGMAQNYPGKNLPAQTTPAFCKIAIRAKRTMQKPFYDIPISLKVQYD